MPHVWESLGTVQSKKETGRPFQAHHRLTPARVVVQPRGYRGTYKAIVGHLGWFHEWDSEAECLKCGGGQVTTILHQSGPAVLPWPSGMAAALHLAWRR